MSRALLFIRTTFSHPVYHPLSRNQFLSSCRAILFLRLNFLPTASLNQALFLCRLPFLWLSYDFARHIQENSAQGNKFTFSIWRRDMARAHEVRGLYLPVLMWTEKRNNFSWHFSAQLQWYSGPFAFLFLTWTACRQHDMALPLWCFQTWRQKKFYETSSGQKILVPRQRWPFETFCQ